MILINGEGEIMKNIKKRHIVIPIALVLIDQLINLSLDYLEIRGIGILDLKDIYLFLGVAVMLGLVVFTKSE